MGQPGTASISLVAQEQHQQLHPAAVPSGQASNAAPAALRLLSLALRLACATPIGCLLPLPWQSRLRAMLQQERADRHPPCNSSSAQEARCSVTHPTAVPRTCHDVVPRGAGEGTASLPCGSGSSGAGLLNLFAAAPAAGLLWGSATRASMLTTQQPRTTSSGAYSGRLGSFSSAPLPRGPHNGSEAASGAMASTSRRGLRCSGTRLSSVGFSSDEEDEEQQQQQGASVCGYPALSLQAVISAGAAGAGSGSTDTGVHAGLRSTAMASLVEPPSATTSGSSSTSSNGSNGSGSGRNSSRSSSRSNVSTSAETASAAVQVDFDDTEWPGSASTPVTVVPAHSLPAASAATPATPAIHLLHTTALTQVATHPASAPAVAHAAPAPTPESSIGDLTPHVAGPAPPPASPSGMPPSWTSPQGPSFSSSHHTPGAGKGASLLSLGAAPQAPGQGLQDNSPCLPVPSRSLMLLASEMGVSPAAAATPTSSRPPRGPIACASPTCHRLGTPSSGTATGQGVLGPMAAATAAARGHGGAGASGGGTSIAPARGHSLSLPKPAQSPTPGNEGGQVGTAALTQADLGAAGGPGARGASLGRYSVDLQAGRLQARRGLGHVSSAASEAAPSPPGSPALSTSSSIGGYGRQLKAAFGRGLGSAGGVARAGAGVNAAGPEVSAMSVSGRRSEAGGNSSVSSSWSQASGGWGLAARRPWR